MRTKISKHSSGGEWPTPKLVRYLGRRRTLNRPLRCVRMMAKRPQSRKLCKTLEIWSRITRRGKRTRPLGCSSFLKTDLKKRKGTNANWYKNQLSLSLKFRNWTKVMVPRSQLDLKSKFTISASLTDALSTTATRGIQCNLFLEPGQWSEVGMKASHSCAKARKQFWSVLLNTPMVRQVLVQPWAVWSPQMLLSTLRLKLSILSLQLSAKFRLHSPKLKPSNSSSRSQRSKVCSGKLSCCRWLSSFSSGAGLGFLRLTLNYTNGAVTLGSWWPIFG